MWEALNKLGTELREVSQWQPFLVAGEIRRGVSGR